MHTTPSPAPTTPSRARRRGAVVRLSLVGIALAGLVACADDSGASPSPAPAPSPANPTTPVAPVDPARPTRPTAPVEPVTPTTPTSPTTDGGGSMQAGAPSFATFEVSSSAPCQSGNAEVTMSYATINAVDMEIKIGGGSFAETAGYGPNESDVIASIPCSGAGESTVQMRGCTETHECADSPVRHVTITS